MENEKDLKAGNTMEFQSLEKSTYAVDNWLPSLASALRIELLKAAALSLEMWDSVTLPALKKKMQDAVNECLMVKQVICTPSQFTDCIPLSYVETHDAEHIINRLRRRPKFYKRVLNRVPHTATPSVFGAMFTF